MLGQNISSDKSDKNLILSFSLLMRLFEWCHEDAKDDVEMHRVMEKLVAFNDGVNPLTIDVYDCLINDVNCSKATEEDIDYAYNLGQELADKNCQLDDDGRNYSTVAGEIIATCKDDDCGASNDELESFWDGYNQCEPMKTGKFTELDISDVVNQCCNDSYDCSQNYTFSMGENEPMNQPCENIDEDLEKQIEHIINISR